MARSGVLDRDKLEEAANAYFAQLVREVDQPRDLPADDFDNALAYQIEETGSEIERQDSNLTAHSYTDGDRNAARAMLKPMGVDFDDLGPDGQLAALNHVVRAKRQQMRYLLHSLQSPASRFTPDDELFRQLPTTPSVLPQNIPPETLPRLLRPEVTLGSSIDKFMAYQTKKGWKGSMRDETTRLFGWLKEEIDPDTPVESITLEQAQAFRDCLMDLGKGAQGRKLPLRQKLAFPGQERLKFVTRQRYWRFTKLLFNWIEDEERVPDPIGSLRFEGGRDEVQESPEPFTSDELKRFLRSPLFTGYKSPHRTKQVGDCHIRGGHWWSAIIMMFTGMRASDVVQLLPTECDNGHMGSDQWDLVLRTRSR